MDPDENLLDEKVTLPGSNYAFSGPELSDDLVTQPLGRVTMRYHGIDGRRSQAWAFASDLDSGTAATSTLVTLLASTGFEPTFRHQLDCKPPWVPHLVWNGSGDARETDLRFTDYYQTFTEPCETDLAPTGVGSVKSAVVYDQGMCSFVHDLRADVENMVRESSTSLVAGAMDEDFIADGLILDIRRLGVEGRTYVAHDRPSATAVGGGVLYAAGWDLILNPLIPLKDVHIRVAYDFMFEFMPATGEILIARHELVNNITGGGVPGDPITHETIQAILEGMLDSQLDNATARLAAAQRVDITPTAFDCNPNYPPQASAVACGSQIAAVGLGVTLGAARMTGEGLEDFSNPADVARMVAAASDPKRWSCRFRDSELIITPGEPPQKVDHHRCMFQVPVKRVNVYPHQIEGVLFDDSPDLDNASYALWVAAHAAAPGPDRRAAQRRICRRGEEGNLPSSGDGLVVAYRRTALGYQREAEEEICNDCAAWGCVGCEDAPCEVCQ